MLVGSKRLKSYLAIGIVLCASISGFRVPGCLAFTRSFCITSARCVRSTNVEIACHHVTTPFLTRERTLCRASVAPSESAVQSSSLNDLVLQNIQSLRDESNQFAEMFGLSPADAAFYGMFRAIRMTPVPLGLKGKPFVLRHGELVNAFQQETEWPGFFTMNDLEKAVEDDFLDALRGSTDNRKGWKITDVSQPRGESFEEARMTFEDVQAALEKGTVIFNAAGAHIPKLAGPSLACTDATSLPCALNMYVTDKNKRTSAPPHTDRQDVVVVQTSGRKHWRVYTPPDSSLKPSVDIFSRGKGDDSLSLYSLESDLGCELLIETTLNPGDVLFIPAGFPHTTSTVIEDDNAEEADTSVHLTLGIDHHIWDLDYLNARRLALRRSNVKDSALGQMNDEDNPFEGKVNELPLPIRQEILAELPLGLLDQDDVGTTESMIDATAAELERISRTVDADTAVAVNTPIWRETVEKLRQQGVELLETHRDMYIAAIEEGREREAEEAMTAHLNKGVKRVMTPERMQRLSLFRVKRFYDQIAVSKQKLKEWSYEGVVSAEGETQTNDGSVPLPDNWAYTMPVKVGDQVEADLGGAFFPATVTRASGGTYDVQFFDGDRETGLDRRFIKLLAPPPVAEEVDTSKMTPKQLKRWKKQQEKLQKKS